MRNGDYMDVLVFGLVVILILSAGLVAYVWFAGYVIRHAMGAF